ncbi:hypothetical protein VE02_06800 [Pseudogymnoascus sp. 03VT05]|nr:hypothetical protein VE02_06800 [Pseudogymnoascus sp. 03VT05]
MEKDSPPTPPHGDTSTPPPAFLPEKEKDLESNLESPSRSTSHEASRLDPTNFPKNALQPIQSSHSAQLSLSSVVPVDIRVRALGVSVDTHPRNLHSADGLTNLFRPKAPAESRWRPLLDNVSADMERGTLTAIIGGSGSGKTTMLNLMSGRMGDGGGRLRARGSATFNGGLLGGVRSAYVMQQDVLLPTLTVRETLQYSADLRLPPPTTAEERRRVVEEVILELGLKECADTRIGTHVHKGCSGGEKRRTSIGVQLLSNPSVMFLDEPTTGLDATSAYQLVRTLRGLAAKGRTIVMTIHQPRSEIYGVFDNLAILTKGSPVYSGPADGSLPYFKEKGYSLPPFVNPAEFLIDLAAVDNRSPELEEASLEKVRRLKEDWNQESLRKWGDEHSSGGAVIAPGNSDSRRSAFYRQLFVLTVRTTKVTLRDPMGMASCIIEAVLMGIITGWIFFSLGEDQQGIRSREGALYTAAGLQGYLILMYETYRLSIDIELFDRERGEGVVDVVPFLLSRRLARFLMEDLPVPFIFSVIFYFMAGFRADAAQFFVFFAIVLLNHYIAIAFASACISADRSFAGASLIGNLNYTIQSLACGYFIQSNTIPVYVRWLKWISYVYYAFGALCANEFVGHFYDCPLKGGEANPECKQFTGAYVMDSLGFPHNWVSTPILALLGFAILFSILAGLGLRYIPVEMAIGRARNSDADFSSGKEKMSVRSAEEVRAIEIGLSSFALDLDKRTALGKKLPRKTILNPVDATFKAGVLNVIMGPSGSGKTSLLNAMALRLFDRMGTTYLRSGTMTFNAAVPSKAVIRSVCSYVCQDDDALLPSLTVRETLRYAAVLRLPSHMTTSEKHDRAEAILLKMGLKDCADNIVGSDLIKGISGGEKRRVTIAVQILTDPRVLLLDEPTSGLDAFTAASIMDVLRGLANEGRTLILTIHQARSDLYAHFGTVLLLARGGAPCYAGPGSGMLPHFSALGHPCPARTNPADFALDLITVDLQAADREAASRDRVVGLIAAWGREKPAVVAAPGAIATPAELGALMRAPAPFRTAYPLLVRRSLVNLRRQPELLIARIMQVVGIAIIFTLFFAPLKFDYFSVQNRVGFIQEFCALYFVGMLQNVAVYPAEKAVFYREHDDGVYSVEAFLAQYTTVEIPFGIVTCIVFAVLADLAGGLPRTAKVFWVVVFNCFCIVTCGESLGIVFNTFFSHSGFALNLTSIILSISLIMSGILSISMPAFLRGVNYLSPLRYVIRNLAPYTLRPITLTCTAAQALPDGTCTVPDGEAVLALFRLDGNERLELLGVAIATVVYRLLAWALLRVARTHWGDVWGRLVGKG